AVHNPLHDTRTHAKVLPNRLDSQIDDRRIHLNDEHRTTQGGQNQPPAFPIDRYTVGAYGFGVSHLAFRIGYHGRQYMLPIRLHVSTRIEPLRLRFKLEWRQTEEP